MVTDIEIVDKKILNIIQSAFPLVEEPFKQIGDKLGESESEIIGRIQSMKDQNIVRQISAIFDTRRLGYKTTLVAMRFAPENLDRCAQIVNEHPGVSHNYARVGQFNLWFTLAVPPYEDLEESVKAMAKRTGAEAFRIMPTIRFFKIGVNFDMISGEGASKEGYSPDGFGKSEDKQWNKVEPISDFEIGVVRELQEDIPLEARPYEAMASRLGVSQQALFDKAADFKERGMLRRVSAVLHHRRAGFKANSMAVWKVSPERAVEVGNIMASSKWVSHCYERPVFPDWPYSHFAMVHATTRERCEAVAKDLAESTGVDDYLLLYSTREYKKTRVRYFV